MLYTKGEFHGQPDQRKIPTKQSITSKAERELEDKLNKIKIWAMKEVKREIRVAGYGEI